ncbi:hypothetical protein M427DRAFT_419401 [Gonapodya prolifera JEL478]|uniref:RNI-like protein n=1 Tax=Gonapodya prolifera (strain JEL478) TaxID=1344416 RepID=A0A139A572_GONPJ|nr:hypothetical protein M427DRAFT_419401 [Gonapodya prolifera JEL478]|eukprot:KXS11769.1 hypothetical protein M427DRAFT_419401 [Gonapodya prolifera JEL478]
MPSAIVMLPYSWLRHRSSYTPCKPSELQVTVNRSYVIIRTSRWERTCFARSHDLADSGFVPPGVFDLTLPISVIRYQRCIARELDLTGMVLHASNRSKISDALLENTDVVTVRLGDLDLGVAGARDITAALRGCVNLVKLDLQGNRLGPEGRLELANVLDDLKSLLSINIESGSLPCVVFL